MLAPWTRTSSSPRTKPSQASASGAGIRFVTDAVSDLALRGRIIAALAGGIDVDVDGGRVTLCGAVDSWSQREAAERIALRVSGVAGVRNRLKVW